MKTFLRADRVIDGSGETALEGAVVELENDKIVAVHPADQISGEGGVRDFPGCTILPGLIDTHVHLNMPGNGDLLEAVMGEGIGVLMATSTANLARALSLGTTTLRDVGAYKNTAIDVRRALELGYITGSNVLACGPPITITGGHTWMLGGEADGVDQLRRKVRELIKNGADFIKVMGSGGGTLGTMSWLPSFSAKELQAIADEAHRNDRKISVHCLCAESIDDAVLASVDQIEHAGFIINANGQQVFDPGVAERLAKSGIPVTSTLAVGATAINAMLAKPELSDGEQAFLTRWYTMLRQNLEQFTQLRDLGVEFVAGTDAGWRFTTVDSLVLELEMMQCGGYSAMEALVSATRRAAEIIGIGDTTGTLRPGFDADLIVVRGNPLDTLDALRDLELVMQRGKETPCLGRDALGIPSRRCPDVALAYAGS